MCTNLQIILQYTFNLYFLLFLKEKKKKKLNPPGGQSMFMYLKSQKSSKVTLIVQTL